MINYSNIAHCKSQFPKRLNLYFLINIVLFFNAFIPSIQAQVCESQSAPSPHVGAAMNPQYVNLWKQVEGQDIRGSYYGKDGNLSIGEDGWPIETSPRENRQQKHGFRFYPNQVLPFMQNNEIIKVRFKGPASAIQGDLGMQEATWQNIQPNTPNAGYTTAELKLGNGFRQLSTGAYFQIKGHIEDIQIIRPGYNLDDPRLLVDEYVRHAKHWKAFRFMGISNVNGSFDQTWAKRTSKNGPGGYSNGQVYLDLNPIDRPWKLDKSNGMNENLTW